MHPRANGHGSEFSGRLGLDHGSEQIGLRLRFGRGKENYKSMGYKEGGGQKGNLGKRRKKKRKKKGKINL